MIIRTRTTLGIAAAALLAAAVWAQQGQSSPEHEKSMSMTEMMKNCRQHCESTSKSLEEMESMMNDAKESNDPAEMRAAMARMQKSMAEMKEHMDGCMRMMGMMGRMHGKGSGHMSMMEADPPKMTTSREKLQELCDGAFDPKAAPRADYKGKTYYFCSEADKSQFEKDPEKYVKSPR
jgi:YHS domain-containing protein